MTPAQKKAAERVAKLLVKTEANGCSKHEALEAARLAGEIITSYDISLSDVERLHLAEEKADHELFNPTEHGLQDEGTRVAWTEMLARVVARAHGCEILVFDGHSHVLFIGTELPRKVVVYLFGFLQRTARRLADEAYARVKDAYDMAIAAQNGQLFTGVTKPLRFDGPIDAILRELEISMGFAPAAPQPPDETKFKSSFLLAFVVAIEQRFAARASGSGALVLSSGKAREWIKEREAEGDLQEDSNTPPLPEEQALDRSATFEGFASGHEVPIDAHAIEGHAGETRARLAAPRRQLTPGTAPDVVHAPADGDARCGGILHTPQPAAARLMRMRMTYYGRGVIFPQGQVVRATQNADHFTWAVRPEYDDVDSKYVAPAVTSEYLEEVHGR